MLHLRRLTFELRRPRRQTPLGRGRTIYTRAWSGQAVAAVAGRRLSEGLGSAAPVCRASRLLGGLTACCY